MSQRRDQVNPGTSGAAEQHEDWLVLVQDGVVVNAFPSKLHPPPLDAGEAQPFPTQLYRVDGRLPNPPAIGEEVDPKALGWVEVRQAAERS